MFYLTPSIYVCLFSILPLVSLDTSKRAAFGVCLSFVSVAVYREFEPFMSPSTNTLALCAQQVILIVFGAALAIDTRLTDDLNQLLFGIILVLTVCLVALLAIVSSARRHQAEERAQWKWRRPLSREELQIVYEIMNTDAPMSLPLISDGIEMTSPNSVEYNGIEVSLFVLFYSFFYSTFLSCPKSSQSISFTATQSRIRKDETLFAESE